MSLFRFKRRASLDDVTARIITGTGQTLGLVKDGYKPVCDHDGAHPYWRCPNWDALTMGEGYRAW